MKISERKRTGSYVSLGDIIKSLKVNRRVTDGQFAKITGINARSSNARANRLVRDGFLSKDDTGILVKFYMSPENLLAAFAQDRANREKKGKRGIVMANPTPKEMGLLEEAARIEHCDRILMSAGLL